MYEDDGTIVDIADGLNVRFHERTDHYNDPEIDWIWSISTEINNPFGVRNYSGEAAFIVDSSGNVGIGKTVLDEKIKLQVCNQSFDDTDDSGTTTASFVSSGNWSTVLLEHTGCDKNRWGLVTGVGAGSPNL